MKVAVECNSMLLQKALEEYLSGHVVSKDEANLILSDKVMRIHIPSIHVSQSANSDLQVPFTKAELFWKLEEFYLSMLESQFSFTSKEQMKPFIEKLQKRNNSKIAKLARKIS